MKKPRALLLALILLTTVLQLPLAIGFPSWYSPSLSDNEILWVSEYTGDLQNWDERNAPPPYLADEDVGYIHEVKTTGATEGYFGFEDPSGNGTIIDVILHVECYGDDTNDQIQIYVDCSDGSGWVQEGIITIDQLSYDWETLSLVTRIDDWDDIQSVQIYLSYLGIGGGDDIYVRRAYLYIEYDTDPEPEPEPEPRGGGSNPGMKQVLFGGYYDLLSPTATEYNSLMGGYLWTATTETWRAKIVSTDGVIRNLRIKLDDSPGAGTHYDFTVMLNGAPTALTVEIADLATSGSDMVNDITLTSGDKISLQCAPDSNPTARHATWSSVFEGDNGNESLIMGGSGFALSATATEYVQVEGGSNYGVTELNYRQVVPTSGTIKDFYVWIQLDPGNAPDAYRFTVRLNGATVAQSLIVTITADDKAGSDLVHNLVVTAGDVLTMMVEPLNSPAVAPPAIWGMTFVSDINGESIILGATSNNLPQVDTEYNSILPGQDLQTWIANENERYQLGQVCTLKKLHILLFDSPGAGNKYDFTIRLAGADSNIIATVSDAATTGNSGVLEDDVALDEYVSFKVDPDSSPTIRDGYWGLVCFIPITKPSIPTKLFGAGFNASSPYVQLYWTHDLLLFILFEVQNSSDVESWDYLGQNTTTQYTDSQVVNGTERYYRVRACNFVGGEWDNSSFSDINFETVYFVKAAAAEAGDTIIMGAAGVFWIILIIIVPIVALVLKKR